MTNEMNERLEAQSASVDAAEPDFVDRLESRLRVQHAEQARPMRRRVPAFLPRLGLALAVVIAGVAGIAALTARDAGVPVSVIDDEPIAPASEPVLPEQESASALADSTSTPTPTSTLVESEATNVVPDEAVVVVVKPTATVPSVAEPTVVPATAVPTAQPTPTAVVPEQQSTPTPAPSPTTVVVVEPTPTAVPPRPTAVPARPVPATAVPVPTPSVAPTPVETPVATPEPVPIDLSCEVRQAGDAVGVVCEWNEVDLDRLTHYELLRSRNGGDPVVVSRQRAAMPTVYVDRDVESGDQVIYLVRGRGTNDVLLAASVRQVVTVATG